MMNDDILPISRLIEECVENNHHCYHNLNIFDGYVHIVIYSSM